MTSKRALSNWDNRNMALLQISEPGQSLDPHQRRIAVGIDLGTTHSLVAAVRNGMPECLPDAQGQVILPSVVRYLEGGRRQIGRDAQAAQAEDAENTIVVDNGLTAETDLAEVLEGSDTSASAGTNSRHTLSGPPSRGRPQ